MYTGSTHLNMYTDSKYLIFFEQRKTNRMNHLKINPRHKMTTWMHSSAPPSSSLPAGRGGAVQTPWPATRLLQLSGSHQHLLWQLSDSAASAWQHLTGTGTLKRQVSFSSPYSPPSEVKISSKWTTYFKATSIPPETKHPFSNTNTINNSRSYHLWRA